MKRLGLIFVFLFCALTTSAQQDALISNYQFNQLMINPAYAGVNDITSIDFQFRTQWSGVDGAPNTLLLSGHTSVASNKVGLGFSLVHDQIGVSKNTNFNLTYAYELDLSSNYTLSFGLQTGLFALNYDFSELSIDAPSDPDFLGAGDALSQFNLGGGFFLSSDRFYLGLSAPQLLKVDEEIEGVSGTRYNPHFYVSSGIILDNFQSIKLKPYTILRFTEGAPVSWDLGASALFANVLWAGLFTRNFENFGLTTSIMLDNGIRLGYTGEFTFNDVPESSFSTHEVFIGIDFSLTEKQSVVKRYY